MTPRHLRRILILALYGLLGLAGCGENAPATGEPLARYDVIIRGGTIYDGSGTAGLRADLGINGDRIAALGDLSGSDAAQVVDASGMAVAPGFINMLSWAVDSLIHDGRGQSDLRQGVTLEVFGEGISWGPLNESLKNYLLSTQGDIKYPIEWTTLGEYLEYLEKRGISPNVASFVGATTVRAHVLGFQDRPPDAAELEQMQALVRQAMEEGAMGVGSSLIYAPAFYADTAELIALNRAAAPYGGMYISHMRSEGNRLLESVQELIDIASSAGVRAEIYHLKAAGRNNWTKLAKVYEMVEKARSEGLVITADMYTYTAGATGLDAAQPPWVQEGGNEAWFKRLRDPEVRSRVLKEMTTPSDDWENLFLAAGAEKTILVGFKTEALKPLTGKTLAEVAAMRNSTPEETILDLVVEDGSRVGTIYFLMSEENVASQIAQPWMSFGSDADAQAPEGPFLASNPHPRTYGNFARLLGRYVRDEQVISLQEAIRRLTALPAENLRIRERGMLKQGFYADVVVFDPAQIQDHATFEKPHQYATGIAHVWVNGEQVIRNGEHTGATPGRVVRGPGWRGWREGR
jgi:N-acyl-D-amino-acid deacylase